MPRLHPDRVRAASALPPIEEAVNY